MKRLTFLFALSVLTLAFSVNSNAQAVGTHMTNPNALTLDTGSQAAAEGPLLRVAGPAKTVSIVVKTLKISGTIAGTIAWQASNDGVGYATISTTALVDASTNYLYKEVDKGYLYYKALITQTGTSSLSYQAHLYVTQTR